MTARFLALPLLISSVTCIPVLASGADCTSVFNLGCPGHRYYYGYPYLESQGVRYDPYLSYKSSYFPETYGGDGSYYGLGYSGYGGRGWYGSYWYW